MERRAKNGVRLGVPGEGGGGGRGGSGLSHNRNKQKQAHAGPVDRSTVNIPAD